MRVILVVPEVFVGRVHSVLICLCSRRNLLKLLIAYIFTRFQIHWVLLLLFFFFNACFGCLHLCPWNSLSVALCFMNPHYHAVHLFANSLRAISCCQMLGRLGPIVTSWIRSERKRYAWTSWRASWADTRRDFMTSSFTRPELRYRAAHTDQTLSRSQILITLVYVGSVVILCNQYETHLIIYTAISVFTANC